MSHIPTTKAPNLANPFEEYSREQLLQIINQLRIYFNQVDGTNQQVITNLDGLTSLHWLGDY